MAARAAGGAARPGPPAEPPPAPPGLWGRQASGGTTGAAGAAGAAWPAEDGAATKQREISNTIAAQVQKMLEQARVDTENKVKVELKGVKDRLALMDTALDDMLAQLDAVESASSMDQDSIGRDLAKLEQTWGQEIRTLKDELHQTILAHNHNADLIKHHKDTIDELRNRVSRLQNGGRARSTADLKAQCARLEALPKQPQMQKLDPLMERLAKLERQVSAHHMRHGGGKGAWPYAGAFGAMPWRPQGMPGFGMMPPGMHGRSLGMGPAAFMGGNPFMAAAGLAGKGKGGRGAAGNLAASQHALALASQAAQAQALAGFMAAAGAAELGADDLLGM